MGIDGQSWSLIARNHRKIREIAEAGEVMRFRMNVSLDPKPRIFLPVEIWIIFLSKFMSRFKDTRNDLHNCLRYFTSCRSDNTFSSHRKDSQVEKFNEIGDVSVSIRDFGVEIKSDFEHFSRISRVVNYQIMTIRLESITIWTLTRRMRHNGMNSRALRAWKIIVKSFKRIDLHITRERKIVPWCP